VERVNLPSDAVTHWEQILASRSFDDDEIGDFVDDINRTPVAVSEAISEHLTHSEILLNVLVPRSLEYYERLVGRLDGQPTIVEYVDQVLCGHMRKLVHWREVDGFKHCLLLGSHSLVAQALASTDIDAKNLAAVLAWAATAGDALSRGTAIEAALERAAGDSVVARAISELLHVYTGKGNKDRYDQFKILSSVFVAVYGELGQIRVLATKPPFWRRLAAFAHAALVVRCIISRSTDPARLVDWLRSVRSQVYVLQCYVDLHLEPRWMPEFALVPQLKNELVGRVVTRALNCQSVVEALKLQAQLLGDDEPSLISQIDLLLAQLPGPLEGNISPVTEIHADGYPTMRQALESPTPSASSFAPLVNWALLARIPPELPELATEALRRAQFRIDAAGDSRALGGSLVGLATTAAVTRCHPLADAIFATLRNSRRFYSEEIGIGELFRAGMIACASRGDFGEWITTVGNFISDLAFQELSSQEASTTYALLLHLCGLVPELWATCGPALAALEAVGASS